MSIVKSVAEWIATAAIAGTLAACVEPAATEDEGNPTSEDGNEHIGTTSQAISDNCTTVLDSGNLVIAYGGAAYSFPTQRRNDRQYLISYVDWYGTLTLLGNNEAVWFLATAGRGHEGEVLESWDVRCHQSKIVGHMNYTRRPQGGGLGGNTYYEIK